MRYQPQGAARLDRRHKFASNAQAILNGALNSNLVSGQPLVAGLSGYARIGQSAGLAWAFRKNFYVESEVLPAIGTASFVEFWVGYPRTAGTQGASTTPAFLTGSSANQLGIFAFKGNGFSSNGTNDNVWGAVYDWNGSTALNSAEDVLTPGAFTVLVVVRRQSGMELWRNGVLTRFIPQAPVNYPAQTLICGAFIENSAFWTTDNDTLLAGRTLTPTEPTSEEIKQFSANPWQLFLSPHEEDEVAGLTLTPIAAALALAGYAPTVTQPRSIAPAAATLTLAGNAPAITQPLTLAPAGTALALTGLAPTVSQVMPQTVAPAGAVLSLVGNTPGVTQGAQAPAPASGGGGGPVRDVRAFADMLDRARKPTRSQKKARRQQLEAEALELLPDLPDAEKLAPLAARIVFEQEARALAPLYAERPIQALAPVAVPFDAHAALRDLVARLVAEAQLQHDDESDIELLLLGS